MSQSVPLSRLVQRPTEVASLAAEQDVILARRDDEDLYLSTRARHEREAQGLRITTVALAALARVRPDLAGDALTEALPWLAWLPVDEKVACRQELLDDLRAGAETGELGRFAIDLAAWKSTAVVWSDPDLTGSLLTPRDGQELAPDESVIAKPEA